MARRYVDRLRQRLQALTPEERVQWLQAETTCKTPSVRCTSSWLLKVPQDLTSEQEVFITRLCEINTEVQAVRDVSQAFQQMLQER